MTRGEVARNYFLEGYTCSQAVALAFREELDIPEPILLRATIALGGGMGRLRQTCGAVSGCAVLLGLFFPERNKSEIYALVQRLAGRFAERNGSYNCGELLKGAHVQADTSPTAEARTPEYYKKRPCPLLIADAADLLEELLKEEGRLK